MADKSDLHVLVVSTWYPHRTDKLIGIYHKHFCQALAKRGVKVNMLNIDRYGISNFWRFPFMKRNYQVECEGYTTYFRRMLNLRRISFDLQTRLHAKNLEKLYYAYEKEHGKPDVIHGQVMVPGGYAAAMLGKKIGVPVVITEHASYFQRFFSGREGKFGKLAVENADVISCVGKYMQDIYAEKFNINAKLLPNIVNCSAYSGEKKKAEDGKLHFATVSALRDGKRIDMSIAALKRLRDENAIGPFVYTVVGDGYWMGTYKAAAEKMGMSDCVEFVGRKTTEEIAQILSRTDALLIASEVETFSIPAVEALAAGVPVVSTRCGGPEGFLTPDCSELCDGDDAEAMADAILRLCNRLDTIDETKVRQVAKQFDGEVVANQAIAIYNEVIHKS